MEPVWIHSTSRRADDAASKDFMVWNGIWVHLAVIKRRRCKEPSTATLSWARAGTFYPKGSRVRGYRSFYKTGVARPVTAGDEKRFCAPSSTCPALFAITRVHKALPQKCRRIRGGSRRLLNVNWCNDEKTHVGTI